MFADFIYYLKTCYRWLLRCKYSRGFGIQSPSAYSFVCNVINNHEKYDAYDDLEQDRKDESLAFKKMGRLIFCLTQFWQPFYVVMEDYAYSDYAYAACPDSLVRMIDDYYFDEESQRTLVILDMEWLADESLRNELLDHASEQVLLVLRDIHSSKVNSRLWNEIWGDERCGVTYDLYSCGIIFFDKSKFKQHFKINF